VTPADDEAPVTLPAGQARQILKLLLISEQVISALRARGQQRGITAADLEQLAGLLTGGKDDSAALAARLDTAQQDLRAAIMSGDEP
jgi:hypothetical protein